MSAAPLKSFVISAEATDLYDALGRLLADGQRFGVGLLAMRACRDGEGTSAIEMVVTAAPDARASLEQRLSRHPSIAMLVVRPALTDPAVPSRMSAFGTQG